MFWFVIFDAVTLLLLAVEFYLLSQSQLKKLYESATILTILVYRLTTWISISLGLRFDQLGTSQWRYDHKWLGLTVILLVLLFWPKGRGSQYRTILLGIGTGQIIDEISEFFMLLGFPIPLAFRDTLPDLGLIIFTTGLFLLIRSRLTSHR